VAPEDINVTSLGDSELSHFSGESQVLVDAPALPLAMTYVPLAIHTPMMQLTTHVSVCHPGRMVKVGFIPNFQPCEFAIYIEGFPLWILSLEKSFCS
jgi:hypothetical protein